MKPRPRIKHTLSFQERVEAFRDAAAEDARRLSDGEEKELARRRMIARGIRQPRRPARQREMPGAEGERRKDEDRDGQGHDAPAAIKGRRSTAARRRAQRTGTIGRWVFRTDISLADRHQNEPTSWAKRD